VQIVTVQLCIVLHMHGSTYYVLSLCTIKLNILPVCDAPMVRVKHTNA
jgi:hypothetical protein